MTPDTLFTEFKKGFPGRKFSAGLLISFIDFMVALGVPDLKLNNFNDFTSHFKKQDTTNIGKRANTLIVSDGNGKTLSLRPFYNAIEQFFRADNKRFDYPSCAPHATQVWADYIPWLDAICTYSADELAGLRKQVSDFVLDTLANQAFDPATVLIDPPLFRLILETFDLSTQKGEPTGAAFQGIVFGFLRADNPHLQVEIDKVRTGSKRLQRIADIDCWEGERLAISAEVKQYVLSAGAVPDLESFANETARRGALGIVAALGFQDGVRDALEAIGVKPLDTDDLLNIVQLWDPLKQRTAVASFTYYSQHVEKNSVLTSRIKAFLDKAKSGEPTQPLEPAEGGDVA